MSLEAALTSLLGDFKKQHKNGIRNPFRSCNMTFLSETEGLVGMVM